MIAAPSPNVTEAPPKVLSDVQAKLRADPHYLGPSITEGWLRRYQVCAGFELLLRLIYDISLGSAWTNASSDDGYWFGRLHFACDKGVSRNRALIILYSLTLSQV